MTDTQRQLARLRAALDRLGAETEGTRIAAADREYYACFGPLEVLEREPPMTDPNALETAARELLGELKDYRVRPVLRMEALRAALDAEPVAGDRGPRQCAYTNAAGNRCTTTAPYPTHLCDEHANSGYNVATHSPDTEPLGGLSEASPPDAEMRAELEAAGIDVDATLERLGDTIRDGVAHLAAVEARVAAAHAAGRAEMLVVIIAANDALLDDCSEDVEHNIKCHADTLPEVYRAVSEAAKKALDILQVEVHAMLDRNLPTPPADGGPDE